VIVAFAFVLQRCENVVGVDSMRHNSRKKTHPGVDAGEVGVDVAGLICVQLDLDAQQAFSRPVRRWRQHHVADTLRGRVVHGQQDRAVLGVLRLE